MMAEYERAKIVERHRRGKLQAARAGVVNVLSGAPYGYRYVDKHTGGGQARYEIVPDEARVVRQVFAWVGHDRLSIGEVCRRLTHAGEVTRTGKTVWDRSVVWGILKNPAYRGRRRLARRAKSPCAPGYGPSAAVPSSHGVLSPSVMSPPRSGSPLRSRPSWRQTCWRRSRRSSRRINATPANHAVARGTCCKAWCSATTVAMPSTGNPSVTRPPRARRGRMPIIAVSGQMPTALGASASVPIRKSARICWTWRCGKKCVTLLAHPERLAEEYRRRLHAPGRAKRQAQPTLEAQIGKLRQGLARLIDSYAEGLIDKQEFEPRITRLRQRLTALEEQAQQLQDEAALHTELRRIIGRLEDFAAQVHDGLAAADWTSKRELIRALVKRVEVTQDQVNVVFRVDQHPADPDPGKKSLQLCRGSRFRPC